MTIEEAEAAIAELEKTNKELTDEIAGLGTNVGMSDEDLKKLEQKLYNKGFDAARNKLEEDKKNYLLKDDVDKMLAERDKKFSVKTALMKMGIKSPDKALKVIEEDDYEAFGTEEFKVEDFKSKYEDVLVFAKESGGHKNITKNNKIPEQKITSSTYASMSASEKSKMSAADKLALLKD